MTQLKDINDIPTLKGRIAEIENAIAEALRGATPATQMTVETAIEVLAQPELDKLKRRLAEAIGKKNLARWMTPWKKLSI